MLPRRLQEWLPMAQGAGDRLGIDPLLILAVMDRESLGGLALEPRGPTGTGDGGNGLGLMQIDKRAWSDWCAHQLPDGRFIWQDPVLNIDKGATILRECLDAFAGDELLAACAYNAGIAHIKRILLHISSPTTQQKLHDAADAATTGHNYGSDVLSRRRFLRECLLPPPPDDEEPTAS